MEGTKAPILIWRDITTGEKKLFAEEGEERLAARIKLLKESGYRQESSRVKPHQIKTGDFIVYWI
jgi:hypothetical protein